VRFATLHLSGVPSRDIRADMHEWLAARLPRQWRLGRRAACTRKERASGCSFRFKIFSKRPIFRVAFPSCRIPMPHSPHATRSARPSLVTWLFFSVLGATMAAVFTCTLLIDRFVRDEAHHEATLFLQTQADALRDALDRGMAQNYEQVRLIGQLDPVASGTDPAVVRHALDQMHASFPQFAWMGLAGRDGTVIASVDGLLQGRSVAAQPWFSGAQQGMFVRDVHSPLLLDKLLPAQSVPWRFVDIATPVHAPDGSLRGVLCAHLSWTWAAGIKHDLVDTALAKHQGQALIVGTDGTVLLGSAELQGHKLPPQLAGELSAESRTQGAGRFPGLGWNVVLRQPESVAMADFRALQMRTRKAAALLCLFFAPLLWLLSRRLATPLHELAAQMMAGPEDALPPRGNPLYREADLLGRSLDRYAQRHREDAQHLLDLNASLEARVLERTAALMRSEQRLRTITDNLPVLISYIDKDERFQFCNRTYSAWMGIDPVEAVGRTMLELVGQEEYPRRNAHFRRSLGGERADFDVETTWLGVHRHLHGTYIPEVVDGHVEGVYVLISDVTAMKEAEARLETQARTDALTGLPNRYAFNETLAGALTRSRRSELPIALFFLDVDKFKRINDTLGHGAGDEVLKIFAQRLAASVRETDTVARLAGDEFVVILENLHTPAEPLFIARKILAAMGRPFEVNGLQLDITSSIGIAYQGGSHAQPAELLALADKALYEAKEAGRNTFRMAAA
jgi:diguanylate cyclase (GGDEF)-like protein/PAS domain S-box-containing protein